MKKSKYALVAFIAVFAAGVANAQSMNKDAGYYGEVGYLSLKFKDDTDSVTPNLARFVVGKELHKNLSVEGMYAATVSKDSDDLGVSYKGTTYGAYLKPKTEVVAGTEVFARVGVAKRTLSSSEAPDLSATKLAYGIGFQTQFRKNVYGQVDYMNLGKKDDVRAAGVTVSVGVQF